MFCTIAKNSSNISFSQIFLIKISYGEKKSALQNAPSALQVKDWLLYNSIAYRMESQIIKIKTLLRS